MSESKDDKGNFYYYTNKGREYTFNLDDLTTEELIKFEKMTEKQRLRFIANFELQKDSPFTDTVSLKPVADEARNEKYNTYALLKAKINECDKLIKLDAKEGADEPDKVSILDNNKQVLPKYLDDMTYITGDDIKNCMFAFDLDDISLGMLKKYYNRLIDGLDMGGLKKAFLENIKKMYQLLYNQEYTRNKKTYTKRDKQPTQRQLEYEKKLEEITELLRQMATNKGNITTKQTKDKETSKESIREQLDDEIIDDETIDDEIIKATETILEVIKSNIRKNNIEFKEDEQEILDKSYKNKFLSKEATKILREINNETIDEYLNIYQKAVDSYKKLSENQQSETTEPIEKEEEHIELKEETPKVEETPKKEAPQLLTEYMSKSEDEEAEQPNTYKLENFMPGIKNMFKYIAIVRSNTNSIKDYNNENIDKVFPDKLPEFTIREKKPDTNIPTYVYYKPSDKNKKVTISAKITKSRYNYYEIKIYYNNLEAKFNTSANPTYIITDYDKNDKLQYIPNKRIIIQPNGESMESIDVKGKVFGLGYKTTFTSGSLIDKIRNKFLKSINSDIDNLKSKDKSIESRLDDIMNEIKDIKTKLNSQNIPQPPPFKPSQPQPKIYSQQPSFLDDIIKQPRLKPSKPIYHPPEEESDISKILAERRKDIEYSESDESDEEWGEGIQTKKIKLSEFLKKFN